MKLTTLSSSVHVKLLCLVSYHICTLCLYRCRAVYVLLRQPSSSQLHVTSSKLKKEFIVLINTYILDTADVLWRMRAFSHPRPPPPTGARTYLDTVSRSVFQSVNIPCPSLAVSLLMHRAFVGFAMAFIEKVTLSFHSTDSCAGMWTG